MVIEKLSEHHNFANFRCGLGNLDDFIKRKALEYDKNDTAKTYAAVDGGQVIGYYSLTVAGLFQRYCPDSLTAGIDEETIPVVLLGKLAVHKERQSAGIGRGLFKDALKKILKVSEIVGTRALLVHAADAKAKKWYSQFDFDISPANSLHLFLSMDEIRSLVGNLPCKVLQLDEVWSFVGCKEKAKATAIDAHPGDVWTWTGICAESKLIVGWRVGDRSARTAMDFCADLGGRFNVSVRRDAPDDAQDLRASCSENPVVSPELRGTGWGRL